MYRLHHPLWLVVANQMVVVAQTAAVLTAGMALQRWWLGWNGGGCSAGMVAARLEWQRQFGWNGGSSSAGTAAVAGTAAWMVAAAAHMLAAEDLAAAWTAAA